MTLAAFPNGISSFGMPVIGGGSVMTTGDVFFVDSNTGSNGNSGKDKGHPFADLDYAIGRHTASKGGVIFLMPGHTETITAAGGITADIAGIKIIGLGHGNTRPTITLGTLTTASFIVSAADVVIDNILFVANLDNIATCFTVSGKDCTIQNCEFRDTSDALHFYSCILTHTVDNGTDGLAVINCRRTALAAGALAFISVLSNCDRARFIGNFVDSAGTGDVGHFLIMSNKVMLKTEIIGNILIILGATNATVGIFATGSSTSSTGVMAYNLVSSLDTTTELIVTATLDFAQFENYYTGTIAASGKLWPAVDGA